MTQKRAREAAEELGLTANVDTECIPQAVSKPGFTKVDHLVHLEVSCVVIDLETTGLIQRDLSHTLPKSLLKTWPLERSFHVTSSHLFRLLLKRKRLLGFLGIELK
ncbi:uncharacterized protein LOC111108198 isoform X2 [Crassostrea virginica]